MRTFFVKLFQFILLILFVGILIVTFSVRNNPHVYSKLFYYQLNKLDTAEDCSILFIGDSSLGNSLDSKIFTVLSSRKTLNIALNGSYGYAGTYNMLKAACNKHKNIEDVIVMQTIDMLTRDVSIEGYIRSMTTTGDFFEIEDKYSYAKSYINFARTIEPTDFIFQDARPQIKNDYIVQYGSFDFNRISILNSKNINADKLKYLLKIKNFCLDHDIQLTYIHGPMWHETLTISEDYLMSCDSMLLANGIKVIHEVLPISHEEIGNTEDHVAPNYKNQFTGKYFQLLRSSLGSD